MSSFCKLLTFFQQNIGVYAIFNDQSFNDTLTNDIVSFGQLAQFYKVDNLSDFLFGFPYNELRLERSLFLREQILSIQSTN